MTLRLRSEIKLTSHWCKAGRAAALYAVMNLALLACAPLTPNSGPAEVQRATIVTELDSQLVTSETRGLLRQQHYLPAPTADIQLWFPVIAGHLFGTANAETSWPATLDEESRFELPMSEIAAQLEVMALPFDAKETGVLLEPQTVRVARLQAFANSEFTGEPRGKTQWRDSNSGRQMMLVYFDRPCRLLGSLFHSGTELRLDVAIPAAGAYWLQAKRNRLFGTKTYTVRRNEASPVLVVENN